MTGILHLALPAGGQTLPLNTDIHTSAQTTLTCGAGGLSRMPIQGAPVPHWLPFLLALIPQSMLREARRLNHVVVVVP
jgi:hypothetical protein